MRSLPATSPSEFVRFTTDELRERLLVPDLFAEGEVRLVRTAEDRMIIGGVRPGAGRLELPVPAELGSTTFCERHELAVVCLRGRGSVLVDEVSYDMTGFDVLYVGLGAQSVAFEGLADFYLVASPAERAFSTVLARRDEVARVDLGDQESANVRTIRKYIHADGVASGRLVVGITELAPGSVWNTMPAHVHSRRTEIYLYTALAPTAQVVHLCGEPRSTRSIIVGADQAVISPSWSIHSGAGTSNYAFVWAMSGENLDYGDVVNVEMGSLR